MAATLLDLPDELLDVIVNKYCTPFAWREFKLVSRRAHAIFRRINTYDSIAELNYLTGAILADLGRKPWEYSPCNKSNQNSIAHTNNKNTIERISCRIHLLQYFVLNKDISVKLFDRYVVAVCDFILTYYNSEYNIRRDGYCRSMEQIGKVRERLGNDYVCYDSYHLPNYSGEYKYNRFRISDLLIKYTSIKAANSYIANLYVCALLNNCNIIDKTLNCQITFKKSVDNTSGALVESSDKLKQLVANAVGTLSLSTKAYIDPYRFLFDENCIEYSIRYFNPLLVDTYMINKVRYHPDLKHIKASRKERIIKALELQSRAIPEEVIDLALANSIKIQGITI